MTTEETPDNPEYVKPNPAVNPRNIALGEIAATVAKQHEKDVVEDNNFPSIDDDGVITHPGENGPEPEAAAPVVEETPAEVPTPSSETVSAEPAASLEQPKGIDPASEYEVEIDGQKVKVLGQKIIDAGFRTFQKETAADFRLNVASQLLREAESRFAATQPGAKTTETPKDPEGPSDAELAKMIQFGGPEQSAEAIRTLRGRGAVSQEQIQSFIVEQTRSATRDEIAFQNAQEFVNKEYDDLMKNPLTKRLFYLEENRRRAPRERGGEADARPYRDLYKDIGDDLRKGLNLPKPGVATSVATTPAKPTSSAAERRTAKASTPAVPRTAASRLAAADTTAKAKTPSEIIMAMAESRGKNQLTPRRTVKE